MSKQRLSSLISDLTQGRRDENQRQNLKVLLAELCPNAVITCCERMEVECFQSITFNSTGVMVRNASPIVTEMNNEANVSLLKSDLVKRASGVTAKPGQGSPDNKSKKKAPIASGKNGNKWTTPQDAVHKHIKKAKKN